MNGRSVQEQSHAGQKKQHAQKPQKCGRGSELFCVWNPESPRSRAKAWRASEAATKGDEADGKVTYANKICKWGCEVTWSDTGLRDEMLAGAGGRVHLSGHGDS